MFFHWPDYLDEFRKFKYQWTMFLSGQARSLRSVGGSAHLNIEIASIFSKIESLGIFVFLYFMIV